MARQGSSNAFFIISVMHTGTRFLTEVLNCKHDHVGRLSQDDGYIISHAYDPALNDRQDNGVCPVLVSPLRDPKKTWLSWAVRETKTNLASHKEATVQDCFIDSWERLAKLEDIIYVPIDRPEGESQLRLLERKINYGLPLYWPVRSLNADWTKKVGHIPYPSDLPFDDWYDEFDFIYDLPMIREYYKR